MSSKDLVDYCNFRSVQIASRCSYAQVACSVFTINIYQAGNTVISWTEEWFDEFLSDVESNLVERGADEMKLLLGRKPHTCRLTLDITSHVQVTCLPGIAYSTAISFRVESSTGGCGFSVSCEFDFLARFVYNIADPSKCYGSL